MLKRLFKDNTLRRLRIQTPQPQAARHGLALILIVKDEASYVEEWVRFHKTVGVRHFHVYDDGSTDGTPDAFRDCLPAEDLTLIPWCGEYTDYRRRDRLLNRQILAYAHAIMNFGGRYRWMSPLDIDEFILPVQDDTIEQALEAADGFPNISLPWHMFGPSGHLTPPPEGVLRGYTQRARQPVSDNKGLTNFKLILDPCEVDVIGIHAATTKSHGWKTANDIGQLADRGERGPDFYSAARLQLNHYFTRSHQDLERRHARGCIDTERMKAKAVTDQKLRDILADPAEDRTAINICERLGI